MANTKNNRFPDTPFDEDNIDRLAESKPSASEGETEAEKDEQAARLPIVTLLAYNMLGDVATMLQDQHALLLHRYATLSPFIGDSHLPLQQAAHGWEKDYYCSERLVSLVCDIQDMRSAYLKNEKTVARILMPREAYASYDAAINMVSMIVHEHILDGNFKDMPDPDGDDHSFRMNLTTEAIDTADLYMQAVLDDVFTALRDRKPTPASYDEGRAQQHLAEIMEDAPALIAEAGDMLESKELSVIYNELTKRHVTPLLSAALQAMAKPKRQLDQQSVGGAGVSLALVGLSLPVDLEEMPSELGELATVRNSLLVCEAVREHVTKQVFYVQVCATAQREFSIHDEKAMMNLFNRHLAPAWDEKFEQVRSNILTRYTTITGDNVSAKGFAPQASHQPAVFH